MSIDHRLSEIHTLQRELHTMQDEWRRSGGGAGGGGVDGRIERLERQFERLDDKVDRVGDRVGILTERQATLNERVAHLPSKGFIIGVVLSSLAVVAALITFGEKLQALVG